MSTRKFLTALLLAVFAFAANVQAQTQTTAKIKSFVGSVSVKYADGSTAAASADLALPEGAEITTGAGAQATVELHDGIVAVLGQNSTADLEKLSVDAKGIRTGFVNLKSGTIASSLDPKKKSINNYAVKTPKGVAAARGTTYSVSYNGVTYSCVVVGGQVRSMSINEFATFSSSGNNAGGRDVNPGRAEVRSTDSAGQEVAIADVLSGSGAATVGVSSADATQGLALLAAAVASVSNNVSDVTAVIQTIASSAGSSQAATDAVASATAAAAATAASNSALNGGTTGTASTAAATEVAKAIVQAAVQGSVQAGNSNAAATIVATTTAAVAATTNTDRAAATSSVTNLATELSNTANRVSGSTTVDAGQVTTSVQTVISNTSTPIGGATQTTTPVTTTPGAAPSSSSAPATTTETTVVTTPQPIDPTTVSRSN